MKAFGIKSRFVHLEFFQLDRDREGLGKKGDYVGLEVNMRPPGGYTPDMMNFAHSTDVYQIWADMVKLAKRERLQVERQRAKLEKNLGSIRDMSRLPSALFVVDVQKEANAVKEAARLNIPVIAMR